MKFQRSIRMSMLAAAITMPMQQPLIAVVVPTLAATAFLVGCQGKTTDQLTTDVNLLVSGTQALVAALSDPALKVPQNVIDQANKALADLQANAASIGSALSPNASALAAIGQVVNTLSSLLTPYFANAPTYAQVLQAALALLPVILAFGGVASPASAMRAAQHMNPAEARLVLKAAPARLGR